MPHVLGVGFSTASLEDPDFDLLRANLDDAARLRVEFVELPLFTMNVIAGGRILQKQVQRLKDALHGHALRYTVHGPIAVNFMQGRDLVDRHMAVAQATLEIAAELGAIHVILHTGIISARTEGDIESAYGVQREAYARLGDFAAQHGVLIAVENVFTSHPEEHTALPSRLAREIDAIAHPNVRACFDFSHGAITSAAQGANFLDEAKALARVTRHLHIHDSFGDPLRMRTYSRSERIAYGLGDLHLPIGWGNIPWDTVMAECTFEQNAVFNLELPSHFAHALPDCIDAMRGMVERYTTAHGANA
jgi:sugar phosphate isomerase/epimerase